MFAGQPEALEQFRKTDGYHITSLCSAPENVSWQKILKVLLSLLLSRSISDRMTAANPLFRSSAAGSISPDTLSALR